MDFKAMESLSPCNRATPTMTEFRGISLNPKGKDYVPMKPGEGCVAVSIPETKQRKTVCWDYMSKTACAALTEVIEDTFKMQMWLELNEMSR